MRFLNEILLLLSQIRSLQKFSPFGDCHADDWCQLKVIRSDIYLQQSIRENTCLVSVSPTLLRHLNPGTDSFCSSELRLAIGDLVWQPRVRRRRQEFGEPAEERELVEVEAQVGVEGLKVVHRFVPAMYPFLEADETVSLKRQRWRMFDKTNFGKISRT